MIAHIDHVCIKYFVGTGGVQVQSDRRCQVASGIDAGTVTGLTRVIDVNLAEIVIAKRSGYKERISVDVSGTPVQRGVIVNPGSSFTTLDIAVGDRKRRRWKERPCLDRQLRPDGIRAGITG